MRKAGLHPLPGALLFNQSAERVVAEFGASTGVVGRLDQASGVVVAEAGGNRGGNRGQVALYPAKFCFRHRGHETGVNETPVKCTLTTVTRDKASVARLDDISDR